MNYANLLTFTNLQNNISAFIICNVMIFKAIINTEP